MTQPPSLQYNLSTHVACSPPHRHFGSFAPAYPASRLGKSGLGAAGVTTYPCHGFRARTDPSMSLAQLKARPFAAPSVAVILRPSNLSTAYSHGSCNPRSL